MALIYFWTGKKYRDNVASGLDWHLNQDSEVLHKIKAGENLWAFTRRDGEGQDKAYVLAAKFVITRKTRNPPNKKEYGKYRVWGDPVASRFFSCADQDDISEIIKCLSVNPKSEILGHSFRGRNAVKIIDDRDMRSWKNIQKA